MFQTILAFVLLFLALFFILRSAILRFKKKNAGNCGCSKDDCDNEKLKYE